jgi:hypothetical protein
MTAAAAANAMLASSNKLALPNTLLNLHEVLGIGTIGN